MTNFERYRETLEELANSKEPICISQGEPMRCVDCVHCDCDFCCTVIGEYDDSWVRKFIKWGLINI